MQTRRMRTRPVDHTISWQELGQPAVGQHMQLKRVEARVCEGGRLAQRLDCLAISQQRGND